MFQREDHHTHAQGMGVKDYSTCNRISVIPKIASNLLVTMEKALSLHHFIKKFFFVFLNRQHGVKKKKICCNAIIISFTHLKIMGIMSSAFG